MPCDPAVRDGLPGAEVSWPMGALPDRRQRTQKGSHRGACAVDLSPRLARMGAMGWSGPGESRPETEVGTALHELLRSGHYAEGAQDEQDPFDQSLHSYFHLLSLSGADPAPP